MKRSNGCRRSVILGGFFNFNIEMKRVSLAKSIDGRARGRGLHSWYVTICVPKDNVAFVVPTAPDVHFKCCLSADTKIQASI